MSTRACGKDVPSRLWHSWPCTACLHQCSHRHTSQSQQTQIYQVQHSAPSANNRSIKAPPVRSHAALPPGGPGAYATATCMTHACYLLPDRGPAAAEDVQQRHAPVHRAAQHVAPPQPATRMHTCCPFLFFLPTAASPGPSPVSAAAAGDGVGLPAPHAPFGPPAGGTTAGIPAQAPQLPRAPGETVGASPPDSTLPTTGPVGAARPRRASVAYDGPPPAVPAAVSWEAASYAACNAVASWKPAADMPACAHTRHLQRLWCSPMTPMHDTHA